MKKEILYCDMDGVLVQYPELNLTEEDKRQPGFFENLLPIDGALEGFLKLADQYDTYILSTAPWSNIHAWSEKRIWVEKHLGETVFKRLILSHNKGLLKGHYLIDDRTVNGVDGFEGKHIHFGTSQFPNWPSITDYLLNKNGVFI